MKTFEQAVHDLSLPGLICSMVMMVIIDHFGRKWREKKLMKAALENTMWEIKHDPRAWWL